jgi:hypothetical protein
MKKPTLIEKYEWIESLQDKVIDTTTLIGILNDDDIRYDFIKSFNSFNRKEYRRIILDYILNVLSSKTDSFMISDAFHLGEMIDVFNAEIYSYAQKFLKERKLELVKLAAFDYINYYFDQTSFDQYERISADLFKNSRNELVKCQALVNLLICDFNMASNLIIKQIPSYSTTQLYRMVNCISNCFQFRTDNISGFKPMIIILIKDMDINKEVKKELCEILNTK